MNQLIYNYMAKRKVFYSFQYKKDVFRVQQLRNIGSLNGEKPVTPNKWEEVEKKGKKAIKEWIDENMKNKSCVIVLIGEDTANSEWVNYEIKKAWNEGKALLGIYIHNLKDPRTGKSKKGGNPFANFVFKNGDKLSSRVKCYNPSLSDPYNDIKENIEEWIEEAIEAIK